ncbi:hypothetical protein F5X68DRAFT_227566 [Plectosphaerella plurivora]|uniref:Uncharacterized protein n=1 Tax=Plectosphaerella plurivora TaxID=936078 RepID=A0A9P9AEZ6_9PEZI|nr:hypothetical protein F5X68DRAFT_227566 [Plectosphaerella plurivora]
MSGSYSRGKQHKPNGIDENAEFYRSFHFMTKESKENADPPYTTNSTLSGAKAVYVPDFGSSDGLILILGGMQMRDEDDASYMFGGASDQMKEAFSDVWVLSLPSFTWSLVAKFPEIYEREGHACVIPPGDLIRYDANAEPYRAEERLIAA